MKELLRGFYSFNCTHGQCREHALALTPRRICETSKMPVSIAISNGDIYRQKAECAMMSLFKALYGNNNRFCRVNTLALTHRRR